MTAPLAWTPGDPFIGGVNHWPRQRAMGWWKRFDRAEVEADFALIRSLNLSMVRLFLLWEDVQPQPDQINPLVLERLIQVADAAHAQDLTLNLTLFTGHMSAANWPPRWLLTGAPPRPFPWPSVTQGEVVVSGYHNPFHAPLALRAQDLLLRALAERLGDHPALGLWNLGNEPELFARPESAAAGRAWVRERIATLRAHGAGQPVTYGLHFGDLAGDTGLRVDQVFAETDLAVMHAYPMYAPELARDPLDPDFVPFACALTASLSGRPVLMEEFGGPTAPPGSAAGRWRWWALGREIEQFVPDEAALADHFAAVLPRLHESGTLGALCWCFADYAPELWSQPPLSHALHERFFGLTRPDGSLKPHAAVLRDFFAAGPRIRPIPDWARLTVEPDAFYADPAAQLPAVYGAYLSARDRAGRAG